MKDKTIKSDKELVQLSLKDDKYFAALIERYEAKLTRYIFRLIQTDQQTAEDILQEVFIKVYRNLNDFNDKYSFSSWIYRITHNEVISHVRKIKSRPKEITIEDEELSTEFINLLEGETDLAKEFEKKELSKKVREIVYSLPKTWSKAPLNVSTSTSEKDAPECWCKLEL